jgi:crotonobetainyl-CoA:carnitine CoA-transferase CaiB-like acyl-CoA transferase
MFLAGGIAAALFARERDGRGRTVDVALLAGGVWTLAPDLVAASVLGADPPKPGQAGTRVPTGIALLGMYTTADARVLQLNMLATDKYWKTACEALEAPDFAADPALASDAGRAPRMLEIRGRFARTIAARPLAHWMERLRSAGCIFSSFATPTEVQSDPQVVANGYLPRHPNHPRARLAASPVQFDEQPIEVRCGAPGKGEHSDEVLEALGFDAAERARLRHGGALA